MNMNAEAVTRQLLAAQRQQAMQSQQEAMQAALYAQHRQAGQAGALAQGHHDLLQGVGGTAYQQQLQQHLLQQQQQQLQQLQHQQLQQQQQQQRQQQQRQQQQQQQQQQQMPPQGDKRTCPQNGWQYVDPKGNIQGPFSLLEMQLWNTMGYFRNDLRMRCHPDDPFMEFGKMFPSPLIPFESYPRRAPANGHTSSGR